MARNDPILPGATIGVLGSGQLGRMFTIAARKMGYRVHTLSPDTDTPTGQVADVEIKADYEDLDAVAAFARGVDVVTFEFENVSSAATETAERFAPVRPAGRVLHTTQHRLREKTFLSGHGFPVTPFAAVGSLEELREAARRVGLPGVLKSAGFGYDGKGQVKVGSEEELEGAWEKVGRQNIEHRTSNVQHPKEEERQNVQRSTSNVQLPNKGAVAVLEAFVRFEREVSVVAARGMDGAFVHWGVIENDHRNHILDLSLAPARVSDSAAREAVEIARAILEALDVVGVLCVEFFLTTEGRLLVNELAPRPHNSGHLTFDASVTSQFEQQLRAVCGLPLGETRLHSPAAMAQLLGDLWIEKQGRGPFSAPDGNGVGDRFVPNWAAALGDPEVKLHLYGKAEARRGRKMGHLTALAGDVEDARAKVLRAREALMR